jgi:hypothetical protein
MLNYYQYEFQSPEPLFAQVKEELRSYFAAGMIDDLMFDLYVTQALRKLTKVGARPIKTCLLFIDCNEAKLPPDFFDYREVWATFGILSPSFRVPGAYYRSIVTTLTDLYDPCNDNCETDCCVPEQIDHSNCCGSCNPDSVQIITKAQTELQHSIRLSYLLTPGNIATRGYGDLISPNHRMSNTSKFHIQNGKISVEFREGDIYMAYYAKDEDCEGNQLVPVNYRIEQYIIDFIKCKLFEFLWNTTTDETFNQAFQKYKVYEQKKDESYILADIEMKKDTIEKKVARIKKDQHRHDDYRTMLQGNWYRGRRRGNEWGY